MRIFPDLISFHSIIKCFECSINSFAKLNKLPSVRLIYLKIDYSESGNVKSPMNPAALHKFYWTLNNFFYKIERNTILSFDICKNRQFGKWKCENSDKLDAEPVALSDSLHAEHVGNSLKHASLCPIIAADCGEGYLPCDGGTKIFL